MTRACSFFWWEINFVAQIKMQMCAAHRPITKPKFIIDLVVFSRNMTPRTNWDGNRVLVMAEELPYAIFHSRSAGFNM